MTEIEDIKLLTKKEYINNCVKQLDHQIAATAKQWKALRASRDKMEEVLKTL